MKDWTGDLNDDCSLRRFGMLAHVEMMDHGIWWFAIYDDKDQSKDALYHHFELAHPIRLKTGKQARIAAECCMEAIRRTNPTYYTSVAR